MGSKPLELRSTSSPPCVLVVDDSRSNRVLLASIVKRCMPAAWEGTRVLQASDGVHALEVVEQEMGEGRSVAGDGVECPVRLVLLDFSMPRMSGPEMVRRMRADGRESVRGIPVVGVTGNALPEDVDHFKECGAEQVLLKPVSVGGIREVLRDVAGQPN